MSQKKLVSNTYPSSQARESKRPKLAEKTELLSEDETDFELLINSNNKSHRKSTLSAFYASLNKSILTKRRHMVAFIEAIIKKSNECVSLTNQKHNASRKKNMEHFEKNFKQLVDKMVLNIETAKETEAKIIQLQKHLQQNTIVCQENLKQLQACIESFLESSCAIESQNKTELETAQATLRVEMKSLQKQMLVDFQKEELLNMKKSLEQSMMLL